MTKLPSQMMQRGEAAHAAAEVMLEEVADGEEAVLAALRRQMRGPIQNASTSDPEAGAAVPPPRRPGRRVYA